MKGRKQKVRRNSSLFGKAPAEQGKAERVPTFVWITEADDFTVTQRKEGLLDQILCPYNLNRAYQRVVKNKGSHGIDGMKVGALASYLQIHGREIVQSIRQGNYRPNPVRRVEIPKDNGKTRPLGIPTVVDRWVQQAISQVLVPIYEKEFSPHSYGFRPGRSQHQALLQSQEILSEGYRYAVDLDMEKFFDTVNHSYLITLLSEQLKEGSVISLIHKYLNAGVVIGHKFEASTDGVPQGGPLSPLLSNVMLNVLDQELTKRGHRFVRYADDMIIFSKGRKGAERLKRTVTRFIEDRLYLRVNKEKTQVVPMWQIKFLGYSFYKWKGKVRFRVQAKSINRLKDKMRAITNKSNGLGYQRRKTLLSQTIKGWINYYKFAEMKTIMQRLDEWLRRRIRAFTWKNWKRVRTRFKELKRLGADTSKAWEHANTRKGHWRIAKSPVLHKTLTDEVLREQGYVSLKTYYLSVH
ncbi:group II intron reverse transcriptase/maturase [Persicobacter sp. CCB-QB2]|uniref:group II intron reverse transcriptase/maturase n=1 Tax=Persicobacter sp. CCB-QB2 TaxID=1561025 RepID=UPI000B0FD478|nr:group II intron reverse transcriptase/maturase [Persicobacter sp. CCB-QB2]